MAKELGVGVMVLCVKCPSYPILIGMVGEIKAHDPFEWRGEWSTYFPQMDHMTCPSCGGSHRGMCFMMHSFELRPIEDPDQGVEETTDTPVDDEVVA